MQRINSVKLHTLTPGSLHYTHIHTLETHSTHSISATNLSHVHPSSFTLSLGVSDSFLRLYFLLHFLSTSPSFCVWSGTLPCCSNFCSMQLI